MRSGERVFGEIVEKRMAKAGAGDRSRAVAVTDPAAGATAGKEAPRKATCGESHRATAFLQCPRSQQPPVLTTAHARHALETSAAIRSSTSPR